MVKWLKNLFVVEKIVEVEKIVKRDIVIEKIVEKEVLVRGFTAVTKEDHAHIWKNNSKILAYLEEAVIYSMTVKHVNSKREKELVEMVARQQNEILRKFYEEFKK